MSAMASDAPVSAPCRAYLVPPWMMPWDFTLCPPPSVPFSTSTVAKPSRRRRALSQRPATPPPTIKTSVLSDSGMERTSRKNKAGSINQRQGTPAFVVAGHARETSLWRLATFAGMACFHWMPPASFSVGTGHAREWLALRPHLFREHGSLLQVCCQPAPCPRKPHPSPSATSAGSACTHRVPPPRFSVG